MIIGRTPWVVWEQAMANTHTHSVPVFSSVIHIVDWASAMIRSNLDTCRRGHPLIKTMGCEHSEDALGWGEQAVVHTHTHTHTVPLVIHRVDGASGKDRKQS